MADIVGLVASVLQLVDTVVRAHNHVRDFRDAPKHQQQLLTEILNLQTLVSEFDIRINTGAPNNRMQEAGKPLIQLKETLDRLTKKLGSGGTSTRFTWPLWGKEEVRQGLDVIERFKSSLSLWLGMDIRDYIAVAVEDILEEQRANDGYVMSSVNRLGQDQQEIHEQTISTLKDGDEEHRVAHNYIAKTARDIARAQEYDRDARKRKAIIEWYSPLNFFPRQEDIFKVCQPGTCELILKDARFDTWKRGTGKTLWCRGIPGAGKTVFVSIVVDHLRKDLDHDAVGVAAVYLNHKEADASPSILLASLWRQLVFGKPIPLNLHKLYAKHREPGTRPSLDDDHAVLRSIISGYSQVFILVDALDEYPERDRSILLRRLCALGPTVSLMFTSRPHIHIADIFPNSETLEIRATEDDIRLFIDAQIPRSPRLSRHITSRPALRDEICSGIAQRSDGMFLLARFHLDSLTELNTIKAVRQALNHLPVDLDSTYDDITDRINRQKESDKKLAWLALSWIIHAKRPLRPSELIEALAVEPDTTTLDPDNILEMDIILFVCTGLLIVTGKDNIVRLAHYTTQGYLERVQAREFLDAATDITRTCITFLSFDVFVQEQDVRSRRDLDSPHQHPFLGYAVQYTLIHARGRPESEISPLILSFLTNNLSWRRRFRLRHCFGTFNLFPPMSAPPLWVAAWFGLSELCRLIIQEQGAGTVLQEAVSQHHSNAVRVLLEAGVDVNAKEEQYGTAMYQALKVNECEAMKWLVEHGADVNTKGGKHGTALHLISYMGRYEEARALLAHGAHINALDSSGNPALHSALIRGRHTVARLLIDHGAVVDAKQFEEPLRSLAGGGWHVASVLFLLEHGVDVNAADKYGCTALHRSVLYHNPNHIELARLLIEHGADVNAGSELHGTPLIIASRRNHIGVARFLIERGASVNAVGGKPYESAASGLSDFMIPIDQLNQHGGCTALYEASRWGHTEIVRLLLDHGADVNAQAGHGTALGAAVTFRGHEHIRAVRWLIEHDADVDAKADVYGMTPLALASRAGNMWAVQLLIEHGAKVNVEGESWGSVLCAVASAPDFTTSEPVAHFLIKHGADPKGPGTYGLTLLGVAAAHGRIDLVRLLLQHGAEVNAISKSNYTALQAAILHIKSESNAMKMAELLIQSGADINADGGKHGTVLRIALERGTTEIIKILRENGATTTDADTAVDPAVFEAARERWKEPGPRVPPCRGAAIVVRGN
ncbi:ankyrin repeat-containing domain protein [Mycena alexandri]|uniref:Ankyrin repeat-containing domain protein n=1 Tax=Mycena alexandri TaxID=1745969 RepID=A0AAD6S2I6_9AGAR|nr:ankyrin repeat-containing domain protein [Mycena alexandri]